MGNAEIYIIKRMIAARSRLAASASKSRAQDFDGERFEGVVRCVFRWAGWLLLHIIKFSVGLHTLPL